MAPRNQNFSGKHYIQPGQPAQAPQYAGEPSQLVEPSAGSFTQYTAYRSDYPPLYMLDEDLPVPPLSQLTGEIPLHLDDEFLPPAGDPPEDFPEDFPPDAGEGYQSAYIPDGSYIVRDSAHPAGTPARSRSKDRQADRRGRLEKQLSLVVLGLLVCTFGIGTLLLLLLPRSTESKIEKRKLEKFPEFSLENYFSGDYTAGIAKFFDDTVPNRDGLKNVGSNLKSVFGLPKSENSVEFVGKVNQVNKGGAENSSPDPTAAPLENSGSTSVSQPDSQGQPASVNLEGAAGRHMDSATPTPAPSAPPQAEEANMTENGLIVLKLQGHYRALELFGGGSGDSYVQALNSLQGQVGEGVKIWSMPAPLACEFYTPSEYSEYTRSHSECFDAIAAKLNPGIQSINICPVLAQHADEPIYCRTDHHWQALGAYYAAQAFASAAGLPFDDLSTYQEVKKEGFVGSMYSFTQSANLLNDPEDFVYYLPARTPQAVYYDTAFSECLWDDDDFFQESASGSDSYMTFLGGDEYIVKASAQVENGRKLLIIKDSYGNAIPPFLTGSFQEVIVADMRYLERNLVSFIRDMGVTDVLFTMSSYSLVGEKADNLSTLLTQNAGETVTDPHPGTAPTPES